MSTIMSDISSAMKDVGYLSVCIESFLKCCNCQRSVSEPITLTCLHSCCPSCLAELSCTPADAGQQSSKVPPLAKCPVCCEQTDCSSMPKPNKLLCNYKHLTALVSELVYCGTCDAVDTEAVFWCVDCCKGLCDFCFSQHSRFTSGHRSAELESAREWSVSQLTPSAQCDTHKRQMERLCFTCCEHKCRRCRVKCTADKHELQPLSHRKVTEHLSAVVSAIRVSVERLNRTVSSLLKKCRDTTKRLQEARATERKTSLVPRKRTVCTATDNAFEASFRKVYVMCVNLDEIWNTFTTAIRRRSTLSMTVILVARTIEALSGEQFNLKSFLSAKHLLKGIAKCCLSTLEMYLSEHRKYTQEKGACIVVGSVPLTSDVILRLCIGASNHKRAEPCASRQFDKVAATIDPKVDCWDVAVTRDGHVLLAAAAHGLLVYDDRGDYLSTWRPKRLRRGRDGVGCVAALSDGRAAVGVALARHVVLLRRSEAGDSWHEDRRVAVLQFPPWRLAVHDDLLAAAVGRLDYQQELWVAGRTVKLLRLSSSKLLYTHWRQYDIARVALTALCLVTTSYDPVKIESKARPYLIEAFSHSGESFWCYETSDEEATFGICVSGETLSDFYVTLVRRSDWSNSRVIAIGEADGKDHRCVISNTTLRIQVPWYLSLATVGQQRIVLAAASRGRAVGQYRQARVVRLYVATTA